MEKLNVIPSFYIDEKISQEEICDKIEEFVAKRISGLEEMFVYDYCFQTEFETEYNSGKITDMFFELFLKFKNEEFPQKFIFEYGDTIIIKDNNIFFSEENA